MMGESGEDPLLAGEEKRPNRWWAKVRCKSDGTMLTAERQKDGAIKLICETCWDEPEGVSWDGVSTSSGQEKTQS